jgi:hypothetical protein
LLESVVDIASAGGRVREDMVVGVERGAVPDETIYCAKLGVIDILGSNDRCAMNSDLGPFGKTLKRAGDVDCGRHIDG